MLYNCPQNTSLSEVVLFPPHIGDTEKQKLTLLSVTQIIVLHLVI